ncbi:MAG: hypothetical protein RI601_05560 [Desulfurivibrionaceae bacterium]|nr:hypothetical protein [Desulfurivibrionaceae bacterium]
MLRLDHAADAEDGGVFDDILEFADIAGPSSSIFGGKIRAKQGLYSSILKLQGIFFGRGVVGYAISHFPGKGWPTAGVVGLGSGGVLARIPLYAPKNPTSKIRQK